MGTRDARHAHMRISRPRTRKVGFGGDPCGKRSGNLCDAMNKNSTFGIREQPQLLRDEFRDGPPPALASEGDHPRLSKSERRFLFWCIAEGYSIRRTANALGVNPSTVQYWIAKADSSEYIGEELSECGFVVPIRTGRSGKSRRWFCRHCGEVQRKWGDILLHAQSHLDEYVGVSVAPRSRYHYRLERSRVGG